MRNSSELSCEFAAEIDGDDAEFGTLGRNRAHQPDLAAVGRHRHAARRRGAPEAASTTSASTCSGTATPARRPLPVRLARAGKQHDLALHDGGEVVLDRGMDVGDVESHRQPAREGIEIAHVDLALARQLQLPLQPGGELAHHHRDEDEQHEIEDFVRVA